MKKLLSLALVAALSLSLTMMSLAQAKTPAKPSSAAKTQEAPKSAEPAAKKASSRHSAAADKATELIDINTATKEQLLAVPGLGDAYAEKIISGRPYKMKSELKTKKILPDTVYSKVSSKIVAKRKKK
jgi:competence protein ComEA